MNLFKALSRPDGFLKYRLAENNLADFIKWSTKYTAVVEVYNLLKPSGNYTYRQV
jgi:hypothetical protein